MRRRGRNGGRVSGITIMKWAYKSVDQKRRTSLMRFWQKFEGGEEQDSKGKLSEEEESYG